MSISPSNFDPYHDQQHSSNSNSLTTKDEDDESVAAIEVKYDELTDSERQLLIQIIRDYPAIWDNTHEDNKKRNRMNEAYVMVAEKMNDSVNREKVYPVDILKRAWKSLRENFSYYQGKRKNTIKYANDTHSNIKFKFFNQMSFLTKSFASGSNGNSGGSYASYEECISSLLANNNHSSNTPPSVSSESFPNNSQDDHNLTNLLIMDLQSKASPQQNEPANVTQSPQQSNVTQSKASSQELAGQKRHASPIGMSNGSGNLGATKRLKSSSHSNSQQNNQNHQQNQNSQNQIQNSQNHQYFPQLIPAALIIQSTNEDLLKMEMSLEARQFRREILDVVRKYEDIMIEREKISQGKE